MLLIQWLQNLGNHELMLQNRFSDPEFRYRSSQYQPLQFHICLLGSEISKWFSDWSNQSSVDTQLLFSKRDELMGFALSVVFKVPGFSHEGNATKIQCHLSIGSRNYKFKFIISTSKTVKSDHHHLWLGYFSSKLFYKQEWPSGVVAIHAAVYILSRGTLYAEGYVKQCGIRPVYEQDIPQTPVTESSSSPNCIPPIFMRRSIRNFELVPPMTQPKPAPPPDSHRQTTPSDSGNQKAPDNRMHRAPLKQDFSIEDLGKFESLTFG
ncbi:uncharacterized protein LOC116116224 [Pistacia vera]|uniref:uncharacterized protein LOC116116224 n=1 Tax=Pistacia vera TaxID=55513 RepID=UPI0012634E0D|nr:uncharacterized protein LOC116116224 [Pistacia vera]